MDSAAVDIPAVQMQQEMWGKWPGCVLPVCLCVQKQQNVKVRQSEPQRNKERAHSQGNIMMGGCLKRSKIPKRSKLLIFFIPD